MQPVTLSFPYLNIISFAAWTQFLATATLVRFLPMGVQVWLGRAAEAVLGAALDGYVTAANVADE